MEVFDQDFWEENGYIVVPNAVSEEQRHAVVEAIWEFSGKSPNDRDGWYLPPMDNSGMVNMTQHQSLWDTRQSPRLHAAFAQIWGTEKLWVTINRTNLNPPIVPGWDREELLHWDYEVAKRGLRPAVQGVLCLTDTTRDMGGFHCVPGSHRRLDEWQNRHPEGQGPKVTDIAEKSEVVPLENKAGDLIIWHQGLIHGNGRNISDRPRFAQYICMTPAGTSRTPSGLLPVAERVYGDRVESWQLGGYPGEIAAAFGVQEGIVEGWLTKLLKGTETLQNIPTNAEKALLTLEQMTQLPDALTRHDVWNRSDGTPTKTGSPVWNLDSSRISQRIAEALRTEFGLTLTPETANLTPLGRKLLGAEAWD